MKWEGNWNPKQQKALEYLSTDSPVRIVLYGGAAGGGKSYLGCCWQVMRRLRYEGTRGLIGRSELKALKETTLNTLFNVLVDMNLKKDEHYTYNASEHVFRFYNGSEILLKDLFHYPSDPNFDSLGSLEITDYFIDEVAIVSKRAVDVVRSRVRYRLEDYGLQPKGLMSCNPSKGWLYTEFYEPHREGRLPSNMAFVQALPLDNPYLPQSYLEELASLPEDLRKRLLEGDWDYDTSNDKLFEYDNLVQMFNDVAGSGKNYITCDPAAMGDDRTVIGVWHGLTLITIYELKHKFPHEVAQFIRELCNTHKVTLSEVIVDSDGLGIGIAGLLKCRQFLNGSQATDSKQYANLKAECYFKLSDYVKTNKINILDHSRKNTIIKELDAVRNTTKEDSKRTVTRKEEIKKTHNFSPDYADMVMMRMYFELKPNYGKYVSV